MTRRLPVVLGLLVSALGCCVAHAGSSEELRVGVLVTHEGTGVLASAAAPLEPGTLAYPVASSTPSPATIGSAMAGSSLPLVLVAGSAAPVYAAALSRDFPLDSLPSIVILGQRPPPGLTVSSCTSAEGVHLSLWSGADRQRTRRWSAYFYLGYDTEPTCKDAELAD